jgi:hypothetical protein
MGTGQEGHRVGGEESRKAVRPIRLTKRTFPGGDTVWHVWLRDKIISVHTKRKSARAALARCCAAYNAGAADADAQAIRGAKGVHLFYTQVQAGLLGVAVNGDGMCSDNPATQWLVEAIHTLRDYPVDGKNMLLKRWGCVKHRRGIPCPRCAKEEEDLNV